jgi:putative ABC transport system permease protein
MNQRLYHLLLHALPHDFRAEYGADMLDLFRRRERDENILILWLETLADIIPTALREHTHMLFQDLSYTLRTLRRAPVFTAAAILTLALGVGANTAIFSVVNAVMLRQLPYAEPGRLVRIWETNPGRDIAYFTASAPNYASWKEKSTSFETLAAFNGANVNLTGEGEPERLLAGTLTASVVPMLGLQPLMGRAFLEEEDRPGAPRVAMLSEALWRRRFAADPAIVGSSIELNGASTRIVGIAPRELNFPANAQIYIPLRIDLTREHRGNHVLTVMGRLKPAATVGQATAELKSIAASLERAYPDTNRGWTVRLARFHEWIVPERIRTALLVLLGAVALVLLVACVNVANLLVARAVARSREIAVRLALGATRRRIARQLFTESGFIAVCGGLSGAALAWWAVSALKRLIGNSVPRGADIGVDGTVFAFALAIALLTGALFGIAPVYQAASADLSGAIKAGGRHATPGRLLLRKSLVVVELALATMLVIGATLLVRSFNRLQRAELGFQPDRLFTAQISLPRLKYPEKSAVAFYEKLLEELRRAPGVRAAAISSGIPMGAGDYTSMAGRDPRQNGSEGGKGIQAAWRMVSADYFRTMGIPLLRGRYFGLEDEAENAVTIILSRSYARRLYGDEDAVGRQFDLDANGLFTVVGVVGDVRLYSLEQEPGPAMYFPAPRSLWSTMTVVIRTAGDPSTAAGILRRVVRQLDPLQPVHNVRTMDQWIGESSVQARANTVLLTIFGAVALLLAAIGVYGVLAYSVTQRAGEIGVRIALGAGAGGIMRLVIGQGMLLAAIGLAAGAAGALALERAVSTILFGISAHDPATFAGVLASLALVSLLACSLPAWRAGRLDPLQALRQE